MVGRRLQCRRVAGQLGRELIEALRCVVGAVDTVVLAGPARRRAGKGQFNAGPATSTFALSPNSGREERGLSWSAGLIVDRFGKPVEGRLELVMVDDRQVAG